MVVSQCVFDSYWLISLSFFFFLTKLNKIVAKLLCFHYYSHKDTCNVPKPGYKIPSPLVAEGIISSWPELRTDLADLHCLLQYVYHILYLYTPCIYVYMHTLYIYIYKHIFMHGVHTHIYICTFKLIFDIQDIEKNIIEIMCI